MTLLLLLLLSPAPDPAWLLRVAPVEEIAAPDALEPAEAPAPLRLQAKNGAQIPTTTTPIDAGTVNEAEAIPEGDPPQAKLICDGPARMGVPLKCAVEITHRQDVTVAVTAPAEAQIIEGASPAKADGFGQLKTIRRFSIQPKTPKPLRIGGVRVSWQQLGGAEGVVELPTQKIALKSALEGAQDPKFRTFEAPNEGFLERHGPIPYRRLHWPALITTLILVGLALGGLLGWLIKRAMDARRRAPKPYVDPRPAHIIALAELVALAEENLPAKGQIKAFYTRLSEIIRAYLERRFHFTALEMTSDEIRLQIQALNLPLDARLGVEDFLAETDLVKFADFSPADSAVDTVMRLARGLVMSTKEEIQPAEGAGEGAIEAPPAAPAPAKVSLRKDSDDQTEGAP
ncbi:hypothetical protein KKF91_17150 [Myxococcota bacterium]|nr:hypothetical protein [Myxococcota bacterium]MBU1432267.1 hypothetical protein [Myxococcota bacterium]MBU1899785.1 hypothetical protein [Myxococcota bacterium]